MSKCDKHSKQPVGIYQYPLEYCCFIKKLFVGIRECQSMQYILPVMMPGWLVSGSGRPVAFRASGATLDARMVMRQGNGAQVRAFHGLWMDCDALSRVVWPAEDMGKQCTNRGQPCGTAVTSHYPFSIRLLTQMVYSYGSYGGVCRPAKVRSGSCCVPLQQRLV